jgi:hypothetical protein
MSNEQYFVIFGHEDGVSINSVDKEEFLVNLKNGEYGIDPEIYSVFPPYSYFEIKCFRGLIVIKGNVVVPKPKQVVTEYEIE